MRDFVISDFLPVLDPIQVGQREALNHIPFRGVSIDSRTGTKEQAGMVFAAFVGQAADGHAFIEAAAARGAQVALVSRPVPESSIPWIQVDQVGSALSRWAMFYRDQFDRPISAVTGSVGKTTTKHLIASILSRKSHVLASPRSFNNELGLPLTLLSLRPDHDAVVLEMGAKSRGHIKALMQIAKPQTTAVTNVGVAHLEIFGSRMDIAYGKGEIYDDLSISGTAVVNVDDDFASFWLDRLKERPDVQIVRVGGLGSPKTGLDWTARVVEILPECVRFELIHHGARRLIRLPLMGVHHVSNAIMAAAVATAQMKALDWDALVMGLEQVNAVPTRLNQLAGYKGIRLIDDSYNAIPDAVKAAIDVLVTFLEPEKHLVLGDMYELGQVTDWYHTLMGEYAAERGVTHLWTYGRFTYETQKAFLKQGQDVSGAHFEQQAPLIEHLKSVLTGNAVVLVKGSRVMKMEKIVEALSC